MWNAIESLPGVWSWVLRTSIEACVIVAVIRIVQLTLRGRLAPRWHYALWLILLARLALPWTPPSPTSLFNYVEVETPARMLTPTPVVLEYSVHELPSVDIAPPTPSVWDRAKNIGLWPTLWFSGAALLALTIAWKNLAMSRAVRTAQPITSERAIHILDQCAREMAMRRTPLAVATDRVTSPALFGLFRPRLLMPRGLAEYLTDDQLRHVFLHELAHYQRRDLWANWVMTVLLVLHWFNPLVWYACARMRGDRELACDALALSYARPDESNAYGHTILTLLEHRAGFAPLPGLVGILEDRWQLRRRIAAIAVFRRNSYRWTALATLVLFVSTGLLLTDARVKAANDPEGATEPFQVAQNQSDNASRTASPSQKALEKPVSIHLKDIYLSDITHYIANTYNVGIDFDARVVPSEDAVQNGDIVEVPVTLGEVPLFRDKNNGAQFPTNGMVKEINIENVPLKEALQTLLRPLNLDYSLNPGIIWISTPEKIRSETFEVLENRRFELSETLTRNFSIVVANPDQPAADPRIEELRNAVKRMLSPIFAPGTRFEISSFSFDDKKNTITLHYPADRIRAFEKFLDTQEAVVDATASDTESTPPAPTSATESQVLAKDASHDAPTATRTADEPLQIAQNQPDESAQAKIDALRTLLEKPVSIYFEDIQLRDITDFFTKVYKLNFAFDERVVPSREAVKNGDIVEVPVNAGEAPVFRDKNTGAQFPTDGKLPYINLQNVSMKEALQATLRPLNLGYSVRPEGVSISTPKNILAEAQATASDAQRVKPEPTPAAPTTAESPAPTPAAAEPPAPAPTAASPATPATQPTAKLSALETILGVPVWIFFEKVHVRDIFEYFTDTYGLNIIVDNRVIAPRDATENGDLGAVPDKPGVLRSKTTGAEFVSDGIVEYVNLQDVSLKDALHAILRPLNLDYSVQPSFLWISTPKNIRNETFEDLVTRSYRLPESLSKLFAVVMGSPDDTVSEVDIESVNVILDTFLSPITEPGTKKTISIVNFDKQSGRLTLHYPPTRLRAFEEYLQQSAQPDAPTPEPAEVESPTSVPSVSKPPPATPAAVEPPRETPTTPEPTPESQTPALKLLRIQAVPQGVRAQIQSGPSRKWYGVDDKFEQYHVRSIDATKGEVEVYDEVAGSSSVLKCPKQVAVEIHIVEVTNAAASASHWLESALDGNTEFLTPVKREFTVDKPNRIVATLSKGIDFDRMLRRETEGERIRLVAAPNLGLEEHQPGRVAISEEIPYQEADEAETKFEEIGLILDLTPQTIEDDRIRLDVNAVVRWLKEPRAKRDGERPRTDEVSIEGPFWAEYGESLALTGLPAYVPSDGDRDPRKMADHSELVIFIRPTPLTN